jgi:hypothetical protein
MELLRLNLVLHIGHHNNVIPTGWAMDTKTKLKTLTRVMVTQRGN